MIYSLLRSRWHSQRSKNGVFCDRTFNQNPRGKSGHTPDSSFRPATLRLLTAQGKALHERVDSGEPETRKGVRFERTVHVSAEKLGISGVLDLVEVDTKTGRLKPVEYKRGKPKPNPMDEIQLCAQGLCL